MPVTSELPPNSRCASCGYDLTALGADAVCPECGRANITGSDPELLRNAGADFLGLLARGALVIEVSWVLKAVLNAGGMVLGLLAGLNTAVQQFNVPVQLPWLKFIPTQYAANLLLTPSALLIDGAALVGWWMLTSPSPVEVEGESRRKARRLLRVMLAVFLVIELSKFVGMLSPAMKTMATQGYRFTIGTVSWPIAAAIVLGTLVYVVMMLAQFYFSMKHMEDLAARAENPALVRHCKHGLWALPAIYVLGSCMLVGPFVASLGFIWLVGRLRVAIAKHRDASRSPA